MSDIIHTPGIFPMWFKLRGRQLGIKYENDALVYMLDGAPSTRDAFDAVLLEWARSEAVDLVERQPNAGEQ